MDPAIPDAATILQRMENAGEQVRKRLLRAAGALRARGVEYAVVGGNAVAAWVATVDETAVRNTQDVDILVRRVDLNEARGALEEAGFVDHRAASIDIFLDHASSSPRQAVHLVYAEETVKPGESAPNPGVEESTDLGGFRVITSMRSYASN